MNPSRILFPIAGLAVALYPAAATAHLVDTKFGPFYNGLCHPVVTPTDLMLILALALWAGSSGPGTSRVSLISLSGSWLLGAIVGYYGLKNTFVMPLFVPAGINLAIALLVVAGWRPPRHLIVSLALIVGSTFGASNGAEFMALTEGMPLVFAGMVTGVFLLGAWTMSLAVKFNAGWKRILVRVAGSWMAAANLLLIGWELRSVLGK